MQYRPIQVCAVLSLAQQRDNLTSLRVIFCDWVYPVLLRRAQRARVLTPYRSS